MKGDEESECSSVDTDSELPATKKRKREIKFNSMVEVAHSNQLAPSSASWNILQKAGISLPVSHRN